MLATAGIIPLWEKYVKIKYTLLEDNDFKVYDAKLEKEHVGYRPIFQVDGLRHNDMWDREIGKTKVSISLVYVELSSLAMHAMYECTSSNSQNVLNDELMCTAVLCDVCKGVCNLDLPNGIVFDVRAVMTTPKEWIDLHQCKCLETMRGKSN